MGDKMKWGGVICLFNVMGMSGKIMGLVEKMG